MHELPNRSLAVQRSALQSGALIPLKTELMSGPDERFQLRRLVSATPKHLAKAGPKPNPFRPWDQRLEVASLAEHVVLLNKYPVQAGHLLLITSTGKRRLIGCNPATGKRSPRCGLSSLAFGFSTALPQPGQASRTVTCSCCQELQTSCRARWMRSLRRLPKDNHQLRPGNNPWPHVSSPAVALKSCRLVIKGWRLNLRSVQPSAINALCIPTTCCSATSGW